MMRRPRRQHYTFAHHVLPAAFYTSPERFVQVLGERGEHMLRFFWRLSREKGFLSILRWVSAKGLSYEIRKMDDQSTIALITLPEPRGMTEVYFVAAVHRPRTKNSLPTEGGYLARYFTLEYGMAEDLTPGTVLCEWTTSDKWQSDIQHINYGDGPEASPEAFLEVVYALIAADA